MDIDMGLATILSTVFVALVGVIFGYGVLQNRVKTNRHDLERTEKDLREFRTENRDDHRRIHEKLDTIIRNGQKG